MNIEDQAVLQVLYNVFRSRVFHLPQKGNDKT